MTRCVGNLESASHTDRRYLELAVAHAERAEREGSLPIGAAVVGPGGEVIGGGRNRIFSAGDPTRHAEIDALRHAGPALSVEPYVGRCTLYTTMEPCLMCTGAVLLAGIARLVWLVDDTGYGALRRLRDGELYADLFARLVAEKASEPDLERRILHRLAGWDARRGRAESRWAVELEALDGRPSPETRG